MHKVVVHVGYVGWNSIVVYTKCTIDLQQIHTSPIMIRHKWYHSEWYCFVRFILTPAGVHSTKRHYCSQHIYDGHIIGVISLSFFIIFCSLCESLVLLYDVVIYWLALELITVLQEHQQCSSIKWWKISFLDLNHLHKFDSASPSIDDVTNNSYKQRYFEIHLE